MAVFITNFLYALDENGQSTTGKVDELIANSAASSTEAVNDSNVSVGETFNVVFVDLTTGATYDGVYTYIGHDPAFSGFIAQDSFGQFFLFSNDGGIAIGQQMTGFVAEDIPVCFVHGTMIACPDGEHPVETLSTGDLVLTKDGRSVPVKWIGHRHIGTNSYLRRQFVSPVRIMRDAIAPDVPHRDLLVSPDHAILLDGVLIPARLLINGTTVRQQTDRTAVDYYHVELDNHDILIAEGVAAESYLDTGNREFFRNSGKVTTLHPNLLDTGTAISREAGSCVPFVTDAGTVRPIWQRIADRAAELGHAWTTPATTIDPALDVHIDDASIQPVERSDRRLMFVLPAGGSMLRLRSRCSAPNETMPWLEDRRRLGVPVSRLTLRHGAQLENIPLDSPRLTRGWWPMERLGSAVWRWTNGDAIILLPQTSEPIVLEIRLGSTTPYVLTDAAQGLHAA